MFLAAHYRRSGRRSIWPGDTTPPFMRLFCLFPRPHARLVWESLRVLWGLIAMTEELTQSSERGASPCACRPPKRQEPGNPRFHAECPSGTSCCPPWRTQASHPGPTGSTSYSSGKACIATRSARAGPRHTLPSPPSHRSRSELRSGKAASAASSLSATGADSDDARHAVRC